MTVYFGVMHPTFGLIQADPLPFQYPGGEWDLKALLDPLEGSIWIAQVFGADPTDLVKASLFAEAGHDRNQPFVLMLPYLPAARSDREMDGRPCGARVYGNLINSMRAQQLITIDPHSTAAKDKYHFVTALEPYPLIERALEECGHRHRYDAVIAPDKGAVHRASIAAETLGVDLYQAEKQRDTSTGKITGIKMTESLPTSGHHYLVVDDICDGGGTFMGLAEATELPRERLSLWVTHGIFSGKATLLRQRYEHIYTTDSHPGHGRVGVATVIVPTKAYMFENLKDGWREGWL